MSKRQRVYEVSNIHSYSKKKNKYRVSWEGYQKKTWEPEENLQHLDAFKEFVSKKQKLEKKLVKYVFTKTERKSLSQEERFQLLQSQGYKCNLCFDKIGTTLFEVDHIVPLDFGGTNSLINLQVLCPQCHLYKTCDLDRGFIRKILQAKQFNHNLEYSRNEILKVSRIKYSTRNVSRLPRTTDEIFKFSMKIASVVMEELKINNIK